MTRKVEKWISANPWKTAGMIAGLVLGILVLTIGFLKIFIISLLVAGGFFLGKLRDDKVSLSEQIINLFRKK
jgi:uncharacterized membrane protein